MGGASEPDGANDMRKSEAAVQNDIRLHAAGCNHDLWRNNSGACVDAETGRQIRYGLANDSAKVNESIKSSDLIGVTPVLIMPHMVGRVVGVFTAPEVKHSGWNHNKTLDKRERAQLKFMNIVVRAGGIAGFCTSEADYDAMIRRWMDG